MYRIFLVNGRKYLQKDGNDLGVVISYFVWDSETAINIITLTAAANLTKSNCEFDHVLRGLRAFDFEVGSIESKIARR